MAYKIGPLDWLQVVRTSILSTRNIKLLLGVLSATAVSMHFSSLKAFANVTFNLTITEDDINNGGGGGGGGDGPDPNFEGCLLEVLQAGAFGLNTAGDTLDSQLTGGAPGLIRVTSTKPDTGSTSGFQLSLDAPSGFGTAPAGGDTSITFTALMSGTSVTNGINFPQTPGSNPVTLPDTGTTITQLTANLSAFKSDGPYPAGNYTATAVVRCE